MWKIELNKNTMECTIEETNVNLYKNNDMIEDNCFISIYCSEKELLKEYQYKLYNKLQRRLSKQLYDIKQEKEKISDGYNYTFGRVTTLQKRMSALKVGYNLSGDKNIKKQIEWLERVIDIKMEVEK